MNVKIFQDCDYVLTTSNASLDHTQCLLNLANGGQCFFPPWAKSLYVKQWVPTVFAADVLCLSPVTALGFISSPVGSGCPGSLREEGAMEVGLESRTKDKETGAGFVFSKGLTNDTITAVKYSLFQYLFLKNVGQHPHKWDRKYKATRKFQLDIRKGILKFKPFLRKTVWTKLWDSFRNGQQISRLTWSP